MSEYEHPNDDDAEPATPEPAESAEALSPSVRRLVKQYDLDITGLRGTGPDGRIRVGDVMSLLGGRDGRPDDASMRPSPEAPESSPKAAATHEPVQPAPAAEPRAAADAVTTTVFECDAGRILEDRRRHRERGREIALSAYFVAAFARALNETAAFTADRGQRIPVLGVDSPRGRDSAHGLANADRLSVEQITVALCAPPVPTVRRVLLIRHHGPGGSLLAQPARLAPEHAAVLGIGRIRRQVVVRVVDGAETPGIASQCLLTLTFRNDELELHAANELLRRCVRLIECWDAS